MLNDSQCKDYYFTPPYRHFALLDPGNQCLIVHTVERGEARGTQSAGLIGLNHGLLPLPCVTQAGTYSPNPLLQIPNTPKGAGCGRSIAPQFPRPVLALGAKALPARPEHPVHKLPTPDHRPIREISYPAP